MRALTVRQPWASAIAFGPKRVENRTLMTRHRGPLAIHAGKGWSDRGAADRRIAEWQSGRPMPHGELYPLGVILATCELVDCHPAQGCCAPWGEQHYQEAGGRERRNVWHWLLEDVQPLKVPAPASGRLGLWDWIVAQGCAAAADTGPDAGIVPAEQRSTPHD